MIIVASFGRALRMNYGNKVFWALYLLGAVGGGLTMNFGMPYQPIVIPQVGADAPITAMLTFFGLLNPNQSIMFFFFPMKLWVTIFIFQVLLGLMGLYCLY